MPAPLCSLGWTTSPESVDVFTGIRIQFGNSVVDKSAEASRENGLACPVGDPQILSSVANGLLQETEEKAAYGNRTIHLLDGRIVDKN